MEVLFGLYVTCTQRDVSNGDFVLRRTWSSVFSNAFATHIIVLVVRIDPPIEPSKSPEITWEERPKTTW